MDNTLENFRQQLISQNSDITTGSNLTEDIDAAFKALDKLTDTLGEKMNSTECPGCVRNYAVLLGGALNAFNAISDMKYDLEEHGGETC